MLSCQACPTCMSRSTGWLIISSVYSEVEQVRVLALAPRRVALQPLPRSFHLPPPPTSATTVVNRQSAAPESRQGTPEASASSLPPDSAALKRRLGKRPRTTHQHFEVRVEWSTQSEQGNPSGSSCGSINPHCCGDVCVASCASATVALVRFRFPHRCVFPPCVLCNDNLNATPCVQESLRRTAEQYHLANSLLQPHGAADSQAVADGLHAESGPNAGSRPNMESGEDFATTDVPSAAASSAAAEDAPDADAGVCGSRGENPCKRGALQDTVHHPCKMQKRDTAAEEHTSAGGVLHWYPHRLQCVL